MKLSSNVLKVQPSLTLAIDARAKKMKAEGIDVIGLSAGEPDFGTPKHIADAAIEAINTGFTRYTPASGTQELKEAVCMKFKRDNGLEYKPSQIIVNCGAKHSIFVAIFTLVEAGDEVIIPAPYWVSYPEMVRIAGGTPVFVNCTPENGLKMTPDQLRDAITPKTKLLILNSPSNPTGMVYTRKELDALAEVIADSGIYVISDEIYEKLIYGGVEHVSIASFSKELYDQTITVNGVSKAFCMTGWRIGYSAGPEEVINGMNTFQSQETSNPTSISQKAAFAALKGSYDFLKPMIEEYDRRRKFVVDRLNGMEGITCVEPKGAFYVFPDVSGHYGRTVGGVKLSDSMTFSEYMLTKCRIAVVPGVGFGADANVRISYALSMKDLETGLDRFEKGLMQ